MDYVIIGNGIIALTVAFRLSKAVEPRDSITIIGPNDRIGSATKAAAAMLNSYAEIEKQTLLTDVGLYHFELSRKATRMWPEFEHEIINSASNQKPKHSVTSQEVNNSILATGTYVINNTAANDSDDQNFDAIIQALRKFDENFEFVDPKQIPSYSPSQRSRATRAILIPSEGWINPNLLILALESALLQCRQVKFRNAKVDKILKSNGRVVGVALDKDEKVSGDIFLLSNGAAAGEILRSSNLGLNVQPIFYGVGISLELKSPGYPFKNCVRTPNRGGNCGIYTVPLNLGPNNPDDHIVIGASNFLSPEPFFHGRVISVAHLLDSATKEINGYFADAQLVRINVGWRPTTQDTQPLLGKTSIDNLIVATGTKRDGFHLSPILSELITSIMLGKNVDPRFDVFAPERELIRELDRAEAITMGVESLMSQHYQHGYQPSNIRMDGKVRAAFRIELEQLHDEVGAIDWGIHPELINMYSRGHAK